MKSCTHTHHAVLAALLRHDANPLYTVLAAFQVTSFRLFWNWRERQRRTAKSRIKSG